MLDDIFALGQSVLQFFKNLNINTLIFNNFFSKRLKKNTPARHLCIRFCVILSEILVGTLLNM